MNVVELMAQPVVTCRADASLDEAARLMWDRDIGAVIVVNDVGRAVSVITDRDICMAALTCGEAIRGFPVHLAASRKLVSVEPSDSVEHAETLMRRHQLRRLPVLDAEGRPLGVIAMADLARAASVRRGDATLLPGSAVASTLAAISRPSARPTAADAAPQRRFQ